MEIPFAIKYTLRKAYWFFAKPLRKTYRHLFRPSLRGVKVVILNKNKVLLVRPNYAHRQWTFPGGHVDSDETFEKAAIREVAEEVGLKLESLSFIREYETMRDGCKNIVRVYVANTNIRYVQVDEIEIREAAWFPLESLPQDRVTRVDETLAIYREVTQERQAKQGLFHPTGFPHAPPYS